MVEYRLIARTSLVVHEELDVFLDEVKGYKPSRLLYTVEDATSGQFDLIAGFVPTAYDARIYLPSELVDAISLSRLRAQFDEVGRFGKSSVLEGRVEVADNGAILEIFEQNAQWASAVGSNGREPAFVRYGGRTYLAHRNQNLYLLLELGDLEVPLQQNMTELLVHSDLDF